MKLISDEDYKWFLKKKKDEQQELYWREQSRIAEEDPQTKIDAELQRKKIKELGWGGYFKALDKEKKELTKRFRSSPYTTEMHKQIGRQIRRCKYQREFKRQYTVWFVFKYFNYYWKPIKHLALIEYY